MNTHKWQLNYILYFLCIYLKTTCKKIVVTGVTFFNNFRGFYEILFLDFFSAHVVRVTEKQW